VVTKRLLLVLFLTAAVFLPFFSLAAQPITELEERIVTDLGVIVLDMPKENLEQAGFTKDKLISYNVSGNQEYMTFLDISLVGDNITFYLEDGKIKDWFRGTDVGTLEGTSDK